MIKINYIKPFINQYLYFINDILNKELINIINYDCNQSNSLEYSKSYLKSKGFIIDYNIKPQIFKNRLLIYDYTIDKDKNKYFVCKKSAHLYYMITEKDFTGVLRSVSRFSRCLNI